LTSRSSPRTGDNSSQRARETTALLDTERGLPQQPLELILARNLVSLVSLPGLLVDVDGRLVFFNQAAAALSGQQFEELGSLEPEEWSAEYGPFDGAGNVLSREELPLAVTMRESRPAYGRIYLRTAAGLREFEAATLPLAGATGYRGTVVILWPTTGS
jgi:PAS domain-containing protein